MKKALSPPGMPALLLITVMLAAMLAASNSWASKPDAHSTAAEVDRLLRGELLAKGSETAPLTGDELFLRRLTLDLIGDLPTPEQITAFALDPSPTKRDAAARRLLDDEHYGQNWARYWRDVILSRRTEERALLVANPLVVDLTEQLNNNRPWDEIATEFITATGDVRKEGHTAIIVAQDGQTEEAAAEICRIFLGIQIQCAQCHDHVTDRWTRRQFHEFAAFFPRIAGRPLRNAITRTLVVAGDDRGRPGQRKMNGRRGAPEHYMQDLEDPTATGTRMQPVFFLSNEKLPWGTRDAQRRETIAKWITADPWFSKAIVNRLWAELVGQGFYEPVDDLGPDRQTPAPRTLDYLAGKFTESGYDLKWLLQTIVHTDAYQRQSRPRPLPGEVPMRANCPQRLRADQLFSALTSALEIDEAAINGRTTPAGGAYGALRTPRYQFAAIFGFDPSEPRDEVSGSIPQALALMNAPTINSLINGRSSRTMLGRLLREVEDDPAVVVELYLRCLAREPKEKELATCLGHVRSVGDRVEAFEDILWALINSTEFVHRR